MNAKSIKSTLGIMALSAIALAATACGPSAAAAVRPTWITPQVSGTKVSISSADVQKYGMVHFRTSVNGATMTFMAYNFNGQTYARADVCPPCRSTSFSLVGNNLVCDTCGTVFDAKTSNGVSGACVSYPKAEVAFTVDNGNLVMNASDLSTAYQNTLQPGRP